MTQRVTRRQFLNYALMGTGSFMVAGITLPMARFAIDPLFAAGADGDFIQTSIRMDEITDEPVKVDFTFEQKDGWYESEVSDFAWVYKDGDNIIAFSPVCKHLGCTVTWAGDTEKPDMFFCPCHNGYYTKDGKNVPGTPPRGPLDQFEVADSDGYLALGALGANKLVG